MRDNRSVIGERFVAPLHKVLSPETLREKARNRRRALASTAVREQGRRVIGVAASSALTECIYHRTLRIDGFCTDCETLGIVQPGDGDPDGAYFRALDTGRFAR